MAAQSNLVYSSVREVVYVFFRHKVSITLVFLLTVAVVTAATYVWPPSYESDAVILMRLGRENLPADPSIEGAIVNVNQERTSEVKTVLAILESHYLAEQIVDHIGEGWILDRPNLRRNTELPIEEKIDKGIIGMAKRLVRGATDQARDLLVLVKLREDLAPHEEAIKRVKKSLAVEVEKQTNIANLAYQAKTPSLAQVTLDSLITFYMDRHIEVFANQVTPEFFEGRADDLLTLLREREDALAQFRGAHNIASLDKQKEALIDQVSVQEAKLAAAEAATSGLEAQVAKLQEIIKAAPARHELSRVTGRPNFAYDDMSERLIGLRIEETDLAQRYTDDHRPLQSLREQISKLEAKIAAEPKTLTEVTDGLDANRESWEHTLKSESANLEAKRASRDVNEREVMRLRERLGELAAAELEHARIMRERELAETEYRSYLDNLHDAQLSSALDGDKISSLSVVQPASQPLDPVRPKKLRNIGLGLLLGLFGGIAFAFLQEFLDDSLNTAETAERRLGVPVLASVSEKEFKGCI